jgi:hypothetical protein
MKTLLRTASVLAALSFVAVAATENEMMGEITSHSGFVLRQNVAEVDAKGVATLIVRYEAAKLESDGPAPMSYDSTRVGPGAKKNDPKLAAIFEPMLKSELTLKVEPTGRVAEIKGLKEMLEKSFAGADPSNPLDPAALLKDAFDEDAIKRLVEINVFPTEPIAPGKKWTRSASQKLPKLGTLKFDFENTFVGVETREGRRCAAIGLGGKMTLAPETGQRMPMNVSLGASTIAGTMYFDIDAGRLVDVHTETTMDIHIAVGGEANPALEFDMPMTARQHMLLIGDDAPMFP